MCQAVAVNSHDPDEFLFITDLPDMQLASVHLTWKIEIDPTWPYTIGYRDWETFRMSCDSTEL